MTMTSAPPSVQTVRDQPSYLPEPPKKHHGLPGQLRVIPILLILAAIGGALVWRWTRPVGPPPFTASGTVEATEVNVASEITGRVKDVLVREGDPVTAGQELVRIDDSLLQLQYRQGGPADQQLVAEQIQRTVLRSPINGTVIRRVIQPGEVAVAGSPLLVVADLNDLDLTIYILERDIGGVRVGQTVSIRSDSLPGQTLQGTVSSISSKAEFTPRNVQTQKDRLALVFGVKVQIYSDGGMKPGMPVDAWLQQ